MTDLTALGHLDQYHYGGIQAGPVSEEVRRVTLPELKLGGKFGAVSNCGTSIVFDWRDYPPCGPAPGIPRESDRSD